MQLRYSRIGGLLDHSELCGFEGDITNEYTQPFRAYPTTPMNDLSAQQICGRPQHPSVRLALWVSTAPFEQILTDLLGASEVNPGRSVNAVANQA